MIGRRWWRQNRRKRTERGRRRTFSATSALPSGESSGCSESYNRFRVCFCCSHLQREGQAAVGLEDVGDVRHVARVQGSDCASVRCGSSRSRSSSSNSSSSSSSSAAATCSSTVSQVKQPKCKRCNKSGSRPKRLADLRSVNDRIVV